MQLLERAAIAMAEKVKPIEIFYSYAHEDEELRDELETHLAALRRQKLITPWHDRQINAGSHWADDIDAHLNSAQIILLLISSNFIDSDYCYSNEMTRALERHRAGEARVIPIILRPTYLSDTPFKNIQALPKDAKPVTKWATHDEAFVNIVQGIREVVEEINGTRTKNIVSKKSKFAKEDGSRDMGNTPLITITPKLNIAITHYYEQLEEYKGKADYELAVRSAFQYLLTDFARVQDWTLFPEQTIKGNIRPDGTLRDNTFGFHRGYWEAKGPKSDLDKEVKKKIADGYPLTNTIFENTRRAILYQSNKRAAEFDLTNRNGLIDLLRQFFSYVEPEHTNFEVAVQEFKIRIPDLAKSVLDIIQREYKLNKRFVKTFDMFAKICRDSLNPRLSDEDINKMLVQHLLTIRLFRTVFDNPDFTKRNVIAAEIEKVIDALTSREYSLTVFLKPLDRYYVAIEGAAKGLSSWKERQHFLNTVYEQFFQGASVKDAGTFGIVYTPQEIVDFMIDSVEEVLSREFKTTIDEPGVQILDPATGTGSFIANIMHKVQNHKLKYKYQHDFFCNEIMLLPYYVASLNIEHEYYERMGEYEPFEGIVFADTLELAESNQLSMFAEENTERVKKEKDAPIMVIIGNPPYNFGQENENDNAKNRKHSVVEQRIQNTYAKDSRASNKNALGNLYIRFFRWSVDRLQGRDGVICLVTNNGFIDAISLDGMRKHLQKDFTVIYHLNLKGNARTRGERRRKEGGNVFEDKVRVGIGITLLVRSQYHEEHKILYHEVDDYWKSKQKREYLRILKNINSVEWTPVVVDAHNNWLLRSKASDFATYVPMGSKEEKAVRSVETKVIFKMYGSGVKSNRDPWVYDFNRDSLARKIKLLIATYNSEIDRWRRRENTSNSNVDDFVLYESAKIKWSEGLKSSLLRHQYTNFSESKIRHALSGPFCKKWFYFDRILNERLYQFTKIFPTSATEQENIIICATGPGADYQTFFASNFVVDTKFGIGGNSTIQCFPFYTYDEDGNNRRENITDWTLQKFQVKYGTDVSKWDIFHYIYAMLHHPQYRERYIENLKKDLPHIPLLHRAEAFEVCVNFGKRLMALHLNYEQAKEYPLAWIENKNVHFSWRAENMRLSADKSAIFINQSLTLSGIPQESFEYKIGYPSALEWIIEEYQAKEDQRSGIESDPNNLDDEEYFAHLVGKVITVSVETVRLVKELAQAITKEDWLPEEQTDVAEEEVVE